MQKEVIAQLFKAKANAKSDIPKDLITGADEESKKNEKRKSRTAKQKDHMKS